MTAKLEELDALVKAATPGPWVHKNLEPRTFGVAWIDAQPREDGSQWTGIAACGDLAEVVNRIPRNPPDGMTDANAALIVWLVNNAPALLTAQAEEIARKDAALKEIARQDFGGLQGIAEDHRFDAEDYDKETALAKLQAWHDEENVYLMGRIAHRRSVARAALGSPPDA